MYRKPAQRWLKLQNMRRSRRRYKTPGKTGRFLKTRNFGIPQRLALLPLAEACDGLQKDENDSQ